MKYYLKHGDRDDSRFSGKFVAGGSDRLWAKKENSSWNEVALYASSAGKYVLHKTRFALREGGLNQYAVVIFDSAGEAINYLANMDDHPLANLYRELLNYAANTDLFL